MAQNLVALGYNTLPEPMLISIYVIIWRHYNELTIILSHANVLTLKFIWGNRTHTHTRTRTRTHTHTRTYILQYWATKNNFAQIKYSLHSRTCIIAESLGTVRPAMLSIKHWYFPSPRSGASCSINYKQKMWQPKRKNEFRRNSLYRFESRFLSFPVCSMLSYGDILPSKWHPLSWTVCFKPRSFC